MSALARRRKWKASASSPAASRTTSTIFSPSSSAISKRCSAISAAMPLDVDRLRRSAEQCDAGRAPRRIADAAAARLLAPAAARSEAGRCRPPGHRHVGSAAAHAWRADHRRNGSGRRGVARACRSQPARTGDPQSRGQCARRDARRRQAHARNGERPSRRAIRSHAGRSAARASMSCSPSPTPASG